MNLIVDIGNSSLKCAWFDERKLIATRQFQLDQLHPEFPAFIEQFEPKCIAVSNVHSIDQEIFSLLPKDKTLTITHQTPLPIEIDYETPETLGIDRICAAVAARSRYPQLPVLSIDLGTCITYDLIDAKGHYQGGGISPGYAMRLKAMNTFTKRLPEVKPSPDFMSIGTSTSSSMLFGAGHGIAAELDGLITWFSLAHPSLKVILTGGDHSLFEQHIENPIFAAPNLVLEGINEILLYNNSLDE